MSDRDDFARARDDLVAAVRAPIERVLHKVLDWLIDDRRWFWRHDRPRW